MKNILIIIPELNERFKGKKEIMLASLLKKEYNVYLAVMRLKTNMYNDEFNIISLKSFYRLKRLKKRLNIDCSISFSFKTNLYSVISKANDKVIVCVTKYLKGKKIMFRNFLYKKYIFNKADKVIAVSDGIYNSIYKDFKVSKDKLVTINNFIDIKKIDELKDLSIENKYNYIFESDNVIISIGSFIEEKGQVYLIKAMKEVIKNIPSAKLIILGGGSLLTELNKISIEEGVYNSVMLINYKTNPYNYLKKSNLFILTSLYEGMPASIIEALYLGVPVISADCETGPREILSLSNKKIDTIVNCEYGVLIPDLIKNNLTSEEYINYISQSIIKVLSDNALREKYSNISKNRALLFETRKVIKEWVELIEE